MLSRPDHPGTLAGPGEVQLAEEGLRSPLKTDEPQGDEHGRSSRSLLARVWGQQPGGEGNSSSTAGQATVSGEKADQLEDVFFEFNSWRLTEAAQKILIRNAD